MAGGYGAAADRDGGEGEARSGVDSDVAAYGSVRREAAGSHPRDEKTRGNGQVQRRILDPNGLWSRALSPTPGLYYYLPQCGQSALLELLKIMCKHWPVVENSLLNESVTPRDPGRAPKSLQPSGWAGKGLFIHSPTSKTVQPVLEQWWNREGPT